MDIEDYKELMRFHILMCSYDLSEYIYAAVDQSGELAVFTNKPIALISSKLWSLSQPTVNSDKRYLEIAKLPPHIEWKNTLICLK